MNIQIPKILSAGLILLSLAGCTDAGGTIASSQTQQETRTPKVYKIAAIFPMTGDAASYGVEVERVLSYRTEEINSLAAERGYRVEIQYEDTKCDGANAANAFQKLTEVDGIKLILGGLCSSESLGFIPNLKDNHVVALSGWSSSPELEGKSPNFFSMSYNDEFVGKGIADEIGKYQTVALVTEQNDYNEAIRKVVKTTLAEKYPSVKILADEEFVKGGSDFRNTLDKVKATNAEIVFFNPNPGVTAESLIRQFAEIKDWNPKIVSQFSLMNENVVKLAPQKLEGSVVIDAPIIANSEFKKYMDKIVTAKGKLDTIGPYYTASSLDSLNILLNLAVEFDGDADKIQQALATRNFKGYLGDNLSFNGKTFVQGIGVARYEIHDGKAELSKQL